MEKRIVNYLKGLDGGYRYIGVPGVLLEAIARDAIEYVVENADPALLVMDVIDSVMCERCEVLVAYSNASDTDEDGNGVYMCKECVELVRADAAREAQP
jgi:hypothetical protein